MDNDRPSGAGAQGDATAAGGSLLAYYLGILRRRIWLMVPIMTIMVTVGTVKAFKTPVRYGATTRLLVEHQQAARVMKFDGDAQEDRRSDPSFYNTQTELIRSRAVMERVLTHPSYEEMFGESNTPRESSFLGEIKRTVLSVVGAKPVVPPAPWERLMKKVHCFHMRDTLFIDINVTDGDPNVASDLANALAKSYQEHHRQQRINLLGESFALLEKEREKEELALLEAEKALQAFREKAQGVAISTDGDGQQPAVDRLVKLSEQLTEVQLQRIKLNSEIEVMKEALESDTGADEALDERLFAIPVIQTDASLGETRRALAEAEKNLAALSQTYGTLHPRYRAATTNAVLLRTQFKTALNEIISSHDNRLEMLQGQEAELKATYDEQRSVALDLSKESFEYTRLLSTVGRHQRLFESIVERMKEVDVSRGLSRTNIQVVAAATPPRFPLSQGKLRKVLASLFLGIFLGAALSLLFENLDDTIKTPEDLKGRINLPMLGFVPAVQQTEEGEAHEKENLLRQGTAAYKEVLTVVRRRINTLLPGLSGHEDAGQEVGTDEERAYRGTMVVTEPVSSIAEAYRGIRANLFYSMPAEEIRTLSVTSSRPQEGKTTTICNLALSIAQTGKRVLLIDGDLHRPSVNRVLRLDNSIGVTSVLVGQTEFKESLRSVVIDGKTIQDLDVLTAGPSSPNPSELLGSTRMQALLSQAGEEYDWVLVDTPPILFVSDAGILSAMCDGVVVVVKSGNSTRSLLGRTIDQLEGLKSRIIGSVLNNVLVSRVGRHYSTYYQYGYSRYSRDYRRAYYRGDTEAGDRPADSKTVTAEPSPPKEPDTTAGTAADSAILQTLRTEKDRALEEAKALRRKLEEAEGAVKQAQDEGRKDSDKQQAGLRARLQERDGELAALKKALAEATSASSTATRLDGALEEAVRQREEACGKFDREAQAHAKTREAATQKESELSDRIARLEAQAASPPPGPDPVAAEALEKAQNRIAELEARLAEAPSAAAAAGSGTERRRSLLEKKNQAAALQEADLHLRSGNLEQAETVLAELTDATGELDDAWEKLATVYVRQRNAEALETLTDKLRLRGGQGHVHALAWGYLALLKANPAGARNYFEQALAENRRSLLAQQALLKLELDEGNIDAAASAAKRLLKADPDDPVGNHAQASLLVLSGKLKQAERCLRRSIERSKTPEALNDLAALLLQDGQTAECEKMVRHALQIDKTLPGAWKTLGQVLVQTRRLDEAVKAFERALALQPGELGVILQLAELHAGRGNRMRALELAGMLSDRREQLSERDENRLDDIRRKIEIT